MSTDYFINSLVRPLHLLLYIYQIDSKEKYIIGNVTEKKKKNILKIIF